MRSIVTASLGVNGQVKRRVAAVYACRCVRERLYVAFCFDVCECRVCVRVLGTALRCIACRAVVYLLLKTYHEGTVEEQREKNCLEAKRVEIGAICTTLVVVLYLPAIPLSEDHAENQERPQYYD
jgi:hypothetical protein